MFHSAEWMLASPAQSTLPAAPIVNTTAFSISQSPSVASTQLSTAVTTSPPSNVATSQQPLPFQANWQLYTVSPQQQQRGSNMTKHFPQATADTGPEKYAKSLEVSISKSPLLQSVEISPTDVTSALPLSSVAISLTNVTSQCQNTSTSQALPVPSVTISPTDGTLQHQGTSTSRALPSSSVAISPTIVTSQSPDTTSQTVVSPNFATSLAPKIATSQVQAMQQSSTVVAAQATNNTSSDLPKSEASQPENDVAIHLPESSFVATSQCPDISSSQSALSQGVENSAAGQPGLVQTPPAVVKSRAIIWNGQIKWFDNK